MQFQYSILRTQLHSARRIYNNSEACYLNKYFWCIWRKCASKAQSGPRNAFCTWIRKTYWNCILEAVFFTAVHSFCLVPTLCLAALSHFSSLFTCNIWISGTRLRLTPKKILRHCVQRNRYSISASPTSRSPPRDQLFQTKDVYNNPIGLPAKPTALPADDTPVQLIC